VDRLGSEMVIVLLPLREPWAQAIIIIIIIFVIIISSSRI
jgi:hypothetical protein